MKAKELIKKRKFSDCFLRRRKSNISLLNSSEKKNIRKLEREFNIFKKNILNSPELKDDIHTINLILLIKRYDNLSLVKESSDDVLYDKQDYDIELLSKKILTELRIQRLFWYFFSYLKISDEKILSLIPLLKYEYYPMDSYICKEGDKADFVYFLLAGKISFRKKIVFYDNITMKKTNEIEQYIFENGSYFGEWDIIYERKTKLSGYCIKNCHIIKINRETFKTYLEQNFLKVDNESKKFVFNVLKQYITIPPIKLERFIQTDVDLIFYKKNEIIYKENEYNKYVYLIYTGEVNILENITKGEFSILKYFNQNYNNETDDIKLNLNTEKLKKNAKNIDYEKVLKYSINNIKKNINNGNSYENDFFINQSNYKVVSTLSKGSFTAIEISTGFPKYKYTLLSNCDFTSIFRINLISLNEHLDEFLINLLPLFVNLEQQIYDEMKQIKYIDQNILPSNCQKFKSPRNLKMREFWDYNENQQIIEKIEKNLQINEGGFIKLNDFNINLYKQRKILKDQIAENQKNEKEIDLFVKKFTLEKKLRLKYYSVKRRNKSAEIVKKKILYKTNNPIKKKNLFYKTKNFGDFFKYNDNKYDKGDNNDNSVKGNNDKKFDILKNKILQNSFNKMDNDKITIQQIIQSFALFNRDFVKKVFVKSNSMKNFMINKKNQISEEKNDLNDIKQNTFNKKCSLPAVDNFNKRQLNFYNTGLFDIPLASQLKVNHV